MKTIKGFIFDMDGVVIDNHQFHFKAWMEFSKKYDYHLDARIYRDEFNGKTNADLFRMIFGQISDEQLGKYANEKESLYQKLYADEMKPHKGLIDFLEFATLNNYKIALGTSAPTGNVDFILDGLLLRKYFQVIVDGSQVQKGKPDPEVYLKCAAKLGLEPKNCIVFEDAIAGIESGKRAGCQVVGVATSHREEELKSYTDMIISDFTEAKARLTL
jgi:beta-phosphoglucomutase